MNLYDYITSLKTEGTESGGTNKKGFTYRSPADWVDLENNYMPQGLRGDSFTIKFDSVEEHEEMSELANLNVSVEFLADSKNDKYGKKFNDMQFIVKDMCSVADANSEDTTFHLADSNQYKNCSFNYVGDMVLITFSFSVIVDIRVDET